MTAPASVGGYTVVRVLGQGGMGSVLEVLEPGTGRRLALKTIRPDSVDDDLKVRFGREAETLATLRHPNVVTVHRLEVTEAGDPFLVMELVEGTDLARSSPLPVARAVAVTRALAGALAALHAAGIVHRDVKPGNVLLRADGAPVLIDFGLARPLDASPLTRTGALIGSPAWMSPEQVHGGHAIGPPADVHALGLLLLFALTGRHAFDGASLQEVLAAVANHTPRIPRRVPPRLAAILRRALAKDPAARPTASELKDALDALLAAPDRPAWIRYAIGLVLLALIIAVVATRPPPPTDLPPPIVAVPPAPVASSSDARRDDGPVAPLRRFRASRAERDRARLRLAMERPLLVVEGFATSVANEKRLISAAFAADDVLVVHDGDARRIVVVGPRGRRDARIEAGSTRAGGPSAGEYLYALGGALRAAPPRADGGGPDLDASRELAALPGAGSTSAIAVGEALAFVGGAGGLVWVRRGEGAPPAAGHVPCEPLEFVRGGGVAGTWLAAALQRTVGVATRTRLVVWDASGAEARPAGELDVGHTWVRSITGVGRDLLLVPGLLQGGYVVPLPLPAGSVEAAAYVATVGEPDIAAMAVVAGPLDAPATRRVVLGRRRGEVGLCTLEGGALSATVTVVPRRDARLVSVQAAPDGAVFAAVFEDGHVEVWGVPE